MGNIFKLAGENIRRAGVVPVVAAPSDTPTWTPTASATATRTPSLTPSDTPTPTWTPSLTPSLTPSDTPTATWTPTRTPIPTATPTVTPATPFVQTLRDITIRQGPGSEYAAVATLDARTEVRIMGVSEDGAWFLVSLGDDQTGWLTSSSSIVEAFGAVTVVPVAEVPTNTPTKTLTPTATASSTPTPMPTDTVVPTITATFVPSPTLIPPGRLPYLADFEDPAVLNSWDFDPANWQVVNEGIGNILLATGDLRSPLRVAGLAQPEWVESNATSLIINFRVNLDPSSDAARIIFRFSDSGYNVLEVLPGLMLLKRNAPVADVFNRATERVIGSATVPIARDQWYDISIWLDSNRIFVYLDHRLTMIFADEIRPALAAGEILLQALPPVRFDDFLIQRAEPASTHFDEENIPAAWSRTTNITRTTLETESGGNRYLYMDGELTVLPLMQPIRDIALTCRIWVEQGGYTIRLRDNPGGNLQLKAEGGHLTVTHLDGLENVVQNYRVPNFYNRGRWDEVKLSFIGDILQIYRDGRLFFEETIENSPGAGIVKFQTSAFDQVRIDDCLIAETSTSLNAGARFAYALINEVNSRDFRLISSDLDESFADPFRTNEWWQDGLEAMGQYIADPESSEHQNFLRITHRGRPTWRLFRNVVGLGIFGEGEDRRNYGDSTDIFATTSVRFPGNNTGTAWLATRTKSTITGAELLGYRLELRRNMDGTIDAIVRLRGATEDIIFYEDRLRENDPESREDEWITLTVVTQDDKLAFFADERFLVALDNAEVLGGTVALGVESGTTADFDYLLIRDTTPNGG